MEYLESVRVEMRHIVDCSMDRGLDAFKALALGATAVSVGRIIREPLTAEGAEGIRKLIEQMTNELAGAMAATCSPDICSIDPSVLWLSGRKG